MLKRILILIALMIVLVALNWFEDLVAQDLGSLTEEQKTKLIEEYRQQAALKGETGYYQTPAEVDGSSSLPPAAGDSKLSLDPAPAPAKLPPHELRPFGIEFFAQSTEMAPPADIASLDDYVLGPGDNLIIFLWGRVEKEYNLTVDREGKLFIPTVGELTVWGLSLEQFTQRAQKRFAAVYSDFELTCSLGRIRSIRIFITGEVQRPGAYTVSSLVSLFNALSLAGGPNERGSMRLIKLMKKGQPKATVDLYRLLLEGDNSTDIRLESGDVIFVPVAGARVAIEGEIKRPGIYELKGGETAGDLLALAGSPTAQAYLDRILLERVSDYDHWEVLDLNLNP
ncbi:MAG: SLBB domain-containing protein, partial [candidate division Zixibacteria bacterium]|nr:SLBB domain-containing protein [candidate division Zixibacteria bacterium]